MFLSVALLPDLKLDRRCANETGGPVGAFVIDGGLQILSGAAEHLNIDFFRNMHDVLNHE